MSTKNLLLALATDASNYTKGMTLAKTATEQSKKELALWAAENKKSENSMAYIRKELQLNKDMQAVYAKQIDITKNKIAELSKDYDKNASAIEKMRNKLLDAETAQAKLNTRIKEAPSQMFKTAGQSLMNAGGGLTMGVTAPILAAGAGVMSAAWKADEIQRLAEVSGLSAERIQELQYAAAFLDVELEALTNSQRYLTKAMFAAKDGTGTQAQAFKALKVDAIDPATGALRDNRTVMFETLDALQKVQSETYRDAFTLQLFGRSAMELNPLIKAGSGELNRLSIEAHKAGAVLSNEKIGSLDKFADSMDAMKLSIMGTVGELAVALAPAVQTIANSIKGAIPTIKGFIDNLAKTPEQTKNIIMLVGAAAAVGPALSGLGMMALGISALLTPIGAVTAGLIVMTGLLVGAKWYTDNRTNEINNQLGLKPKIASTKEGVLSAWDANTKDRGLGWSKSNEEIAAKKAAVDAAAEAKKQAAAYKAIFDADKNAATAKKLESEREAALQRLTSATQTYIDKITTATDRTLAFWDKITSKSMSVTSIIRNMQKNADISTQMKSDLATLSGAGLDPAVVAELSKQGLSGYKTIHNLATKAQGTDYADINSLYNKQLGNSQQIAYLSSGGRGGVLQYVKQVIINGKEISESSLLDAIYKALEAHGVKLDPVGA